MHYTCRKNNLNAKTETAYASPRVAEELNR